MISFSIRPPTPMSASVIIVSASTGMRVPHVRPPVFAFFELLNVYDSVHRLDARSPVWHCFSSFHIYIETTIREVLLPSSHPFPGKDQPSVGVTRPPHGDRGVATTRQSFVSTVLTPVSCQMLR